MTTTNSAGVLAVLDAIACDYDVLLPECSAEVRKARAAVAELQAKARLWDVVRRFASGEDFDRWEEMARGGHIASDAGNTYADERAAALAGNGKEGA